MPRRKLENKTVEVILLQSDKHLGEKFEIVRVKPVFARNVLLPKILLFWLMPTVEINLHRK